MTCAVAGVPGLEPRRTESESAILPLDDTPTKKDVLIIHPFFETSSVFS